MLPSARQYFNFVILFFISFNLSAQVTDSRVTNKKVTQNDSSTTVKEITDLPEDLKSKLNTTANQDLAQLCVNQLSQFRGFLSAPKQGPQKTLSDICSNALLLDQCHSVNKVPLYHFNFSTNQKNAKKVLVISLIHGDELPAGTVVKYWLERLSQLENPRNQWRVIPVLNPDGLARKTRTNANGVDINRNFPTKDWDHEALKIWKHLKQNPRRYPGAQANSEPETQCALKHLEDFKPDFVVSIHTPLAVLDFDGPKHKSVPHFDYLPWKSLGHYPGSLGRFMWFERKTPVLTAEFYDEAPKTPIHLEKLQDIIGNLVQLL